MKYKYNGEWVYVNIKALDSMPIGVSLEFNGAKNKIPNGWLICDGSAISRTEYADLFNVIGITFGSGDGSTTFNLPNDSGRVSVGVDENDTDFNAVGKTGGSKELQKHSHPLNANTLGSYYSGIGAVLDSGDTSVGRANENPALASTGEAGTGESGNLQPYIAKWKCIKAKNTTPTMASVVNATNNSTTDTYSCDYVNDKLIDRYLINEVKTNKIWADGKPIYRKVISFNTSPTINVWDYVPHQIQNMDKPMPTCSMMVMYNGSWYYCPNDLIIEMYINTTNLSYYNNSSALADKPAFAVIEYTKTTD